jgi:hypothetical protein
MPGPRAAVIGDGAARDLVEPRAESLVVAQIGEPALHAHEHVLQHVVDVDRVDATRDERAQPGRDVGPRHRRAGHAQHAGPQHALALAGLRASMVADATNCSMPGSQLPTTSALRGAMRTSRSTNPAAASMARTSSMGAAPDTQPASAAAWVCSSTGMGPVATTSLIARRPPGRSTRNASCDHRGLVGRQVDDAVREDHVDAVVADGQALDLAEPELDVARLPSLRALSRARFETMSGVMSTPMTRPAGRRPASRARKQSKPPPAPRSSTVSPATELRRSR